MCNGPSNARSGATREVWSPKYTRSNGLKGLSTAQKLSFEIYGIVWLPFVGKSVEEPRESVDFQAEYEGSIPFTRSIGFRYFFALSRIFRAPQAVTFLNLQLTRITRGFLEFRDRFRSVSNCSV